MLGQLIRVQVKAGKVEEFEALVTRSMRGVVDNEQGAIYDVRRVHGAQDLYLLYFIS
jgi:quinol monooxygenase YgiN